MTTDYQRRGIRVPRTETEAADVARDALATGARRTSESFTEPDEDWAPMWFVVTSEHGTLIAGDAHKHDMARYVAGFARRVGAVAIGHLHSSWYVDQSTVSRFEDGSSWPRDPDRRLCSYADDLDIEPRALWCRAVEEWKAAVA